VKIDNHTAYRTKDVLRILRAGLRAHSVPGSPCPPPSDGVTVRYLGERAGQGITVWLPRRVADVGIANVWAPWEAREQLLRAVAADLAAMWDRWCYFFRSVDAPAKSPAAPHWFTDDATLVLRADAPPPVAPKNPREERAARAAAQLAHAEAMLRKATTRLKRAATIEATWKAKVRRARASVEKTKTLAQVLGSETTP
jgi:hypothetical protein